MELVAFLLCFLMILSVINLIFTVTIASTMVKMLKSQEGDTQDLTWASIIKSRRKLDSQNRPPTYADPQWNGMTKEKNWDGLPEPVE